MDPPNGAGHHADRVMKGVAIAAEESAAVEWQHSVSLNADLIFQDEANPRKTEVRCALSIPFSAISWLAVEEIENVLVEDGAMPSFEFLGFNNTVKICTVGDMGKADTAFHVRSGLDVVPKLTVTHHRFITDSLGLGIHIF